ncbi:hypothetical protein [Pontibacillus marinus]|uniref:Uncharacterized protein n=1 Tax=Pontibacillus marinus BH030004 = DSM 16465 TaxID=1385511 RepID=A0A0A5GAU4_9BACI|nr:hypothetical protein [Pontibacillus marinus]KGX90291.1 hypothetical protein N783_21105 [Pontibacillus marinus BH030004 = DSM 16465]
MSRVKRIFLTLVIAVPIVLVISYFTNDEDKDWINADESTIQTFLQNNVGDNVQLDRLKRLGDSELFIATYHLKQNDKEKLGYSLFEEMEEGRVEYRRTDFGATSHAFNVIETDENIYGVLYGTDDSNWKIANVSFSENDKEYSFDHPGESPYLLMKQFDASIENPEEYSVKYQ